MGRRDAALADGPAGDRDDRGAVALSALVAARRARRLRGVDRWDALYRAYVAAVVGGLAVLSLSQVAGDRLVPPEQVPSVAGHGPRVVGVAVAVVLAAGLRSGGRGGPLALDAADVRHVLLAPVDRAVALRRPAWRVLRFGAFAGAAAGAVAGVNASQRLPEPLAVWALSGAIVGATSTVAALGLGLVTSGRRLGRRRAGALGLATVAWGVGDLLAGATTSPMGLLGGLALWPLRSRPVDALGLAVVLAAPLGVAVVGAASIEAAERRSRLVGGIRFAATMRDIRTVLILRRQLADERPRMRPWVRLGPSAARPVGGTGGGAPGGAEAATGAGGHDGGAAGTRSRPPGRPAPSGRPAPPWGVAARRSLAGLARWPAGRLGRFAALSGGAGLLAAAAWPGARVLVVPAGLLAYVAALDAVEPLGQELDHPTLLQSHPRHAGHVRLALLAVPAAAMLVAGAAALAAAVAAGAPAGLVAGVGVPAAVSTALCATAGAAVTVVRGAEVTTEASLAMAASPEAQSTALLVQLALPPGLAVLGTLPVVVAQGAGRPAPAAATAAALLLGVPALTACWVRFREDLAVFTRRLTRA